jgi:hypothetical protein
MEDLTEEITYVAENIVKEAEINRALLALAQKYERTFLEVTEEYGDICFDLGI